MDNVSTMTLKDAMYNGYAADTSEKAVEILYDPEHYGGVILYSRSRDKLRTMCDDVYAEIKKRNAELPLDDQMLPIYPYNFDAVYECLPMHCAEISIGQFKERAGGLFMFSEANYTVLTKPDERRPLSSKAMTTLAMMGHMLSGKG